MNTNNGITVGQPFGKIMDEFFNKSISDIVGTDFTHESPAVNIIEKEDSFELEVAAPGLEKKDFKVLIEKDHLTISAEKEEEVDAESAQQFKRKEYNFQNFTRRFRLPNTVDKSSLKAKYLQGILNVVIQKTPEAKDQGPRTIDID
jgi:HSP20 family protein